MNVQNKQFLSTIQDLTWERIGGPGMLRKVVLKSFQAYVESKKNGCIVKIEKQTDMQGNQTMAMRVGEKEGHIRSTALTDTKTA